MPRLPLSQERNPVTGPETLRCRCCTASGEVNVRWQSSLLSAAVWLASRVPCGVNVLVLWAFPARFNCWFPGVATVGGYLCLMEQDAQYEVGSVERSVFKRVFCSLCGEEANY